MQIARKVSALSWIFMPMHSGDERCQQLWLWRHQLLATLKEHWGIAATRNVGEIVTWSDNATAGDGHTKKTQLSSDHDSVYCVYDIRTRVQSDSDDTLLTQTANQMEFLLRPLLTNSISLHVNVKRQAVWSNSHDPHDHHLINAHYRCINTRKEYEPT